MEINDSMPEVQIDIHAKIPMQMLKYLPPNFHIDLEEALYKKIARMILENNADKLPLQD